jgi:hypothetical protein
MVTPASQRRILTKTENAIRISDPDLASILDLFGRLNRDEEMPLTEQLADRGRHGLSPMPHRPTTRPEPPRANHRNRIAAIVFFVFVAGWVAMLVMTGASAHSACPAAAAYSAANTTACKLTAGTGR